MAADLSHLLSVDARKHKYEKTVKDIVQKVENNHIQTLSLIFCPTDLMT